MRLTQRHSKAAGLCDIAAGMLKVSQGVYRYVQSIGMYNLVYSSQTSDVWNVQVSVIASHNSVEVLVAATKTLSDITVMS